MLTLDVAVPRRAAGDVRAYERVETEPGLDKFVDDPRGTVKRPVLDLTSGMRLLKRLRDMHYASDMAWACSSCKTEAVLLAMAGNAVA